MSVLPLCRGSPPKKEAFPSAAASPPRRTRQCPGSRSVTVVRCTTAAAPSPSVRSCKRRGFPWFRGWPWFRGGVAGVGGRVFFGQQFGEFIAHILETSCYFLFFFKFQLHKSRVMVGPTQPFLTERVVSCNPIPKTLSMCNQENRTIPRKVLYAAQN